ncbi:MAG: hypothetical protein EA398_05210 [Deltaproteobacteria bacterium]|nr:MAG: hypothetical protein EA398_05210 [Deltaproteobacteria bacterium]
MSDLHLLLASTDAPVLLRRWGSLAERVTAAGMACTLAAPGLRAVPGAGVATPIALPHRADTTPGAVAAALALSASFGQRRPDVLIVDGARLARPLAEIARVFRVPAVIALVDGGGRDGGTLGRLLAHAAPLESRVDRTLVLGGPGPLAHGAGVDADLHNPEHDRTADRILAERAACGEDARHLVGAVGSPGDVRRLRDQLWRVARAVRLLPLDPCADEHALAVRVGACDVVVDLRHDALGLDVLLLAAALRVPGLAVAGPSARLLTSAGCGVVPEGRDDESRIRALRGLLADPMQRRRLGAAGRAVAAGAGARRAAEDAVLAAADEVLRERFGEPLHVTTDGQLRSESELREPVVPGRRDLLGG